jgi:hypothetical protein
MLFITMTPKGSKAGEYEAESFEDAAEMAKADGHTVVDFAEYGNQAILVIAD